MAALKSRMIEVIRVSTVGEIVAEYSGIAINSVSSPIRSIKPAEPGRVGACWSPPYEYG